MDDAQKKAPPLLAVRPVFDPALAMVESAAAALAGAVVATFLLATLVFLVFSFIGLGGFIGAGTLYTTFFVLGLALSPAAYFEVKKAALRRTGYNFYADHMEYQDFRFYLQKRRGRVRLVDIRDVYERASPLQSRRMLTSVTLVIAGFPSFVEPRVPGLKMTDVAENGELREKIILLVEDAGRRYRAG